VAPLRLGGLRGKKSTPSDWLGGTGEVSMVSEQERHRAWDVARSAGRHPRQAKGHRYAFHIFMVECVRIHADLLINGRVE
jgi:hypothetical protein